MTLFGGRGVIVAACCGVFAAGCAISPNPDLTAFADAHGANSFEMFDRDVDAPEALVLPVVQDRQTSGPSCGAHALASVVNYWNGAGSLDGEALYRDRPPSDASGYSMAELLDISAENGLLASAVRLSEEDVIAELEHGRPVLAPVRLPSIFVQQRTLPGAEVPVVDFARRTLIHRTARVTEWTRVLMVDHYLLLAGYENDTFIVVEPVMGFRTIKADTLRRYRKPFGDAAIVFSASSEAAGRLEPSLVAAHEPAAVASGG